MGIDVSKSWLDIAVLVPDSGIVSQERIDNTGKAVHAWLKMFFGEQGFAVREVLFCMEHTGRYGLPFLEAATAQKAVVWVELPVQIKKSQGMTRGKTDKWDAVRIARYAFRFSDKADLWKPMDKTVGKIKALQAKRDLLVKTHRQLNQEDKNDPAFRKPLAVLKEAIETLDGKLEQLLLQDTELARQYRLLTSVPGIGLQTAVALIVTTRGFTRLTEKRKLSCYSGTAPFPYRSGSSVKGRDRISKMGDMRIKTLLNMSAWNAIRSVPGLKEFYLRKVQEGKSKLSVINAIRNKIIGMALAVVKRDSPFVKNFSANFS